MKKFFGLVFLFVTLHTHLLAQSKAAAPSRKPLTVKDLNRLEMEKIKAMSVTKTERKDSVIRKVVPVELETTDKIIITKDTLAKIKKPSKDSLLKKAITKINSDTLPKKIAVHTDTLLKNTIVKESQQLMLLKDTTTAIQQKVTKNDTLIRIYTKAEQLADSIKNAHKHWLDSTLTALPKHKPVVMNADDEIEIFISGGGLYTGVNPTIYDRTTLYNSGLIHKETRTKLQGAQVTDKKISKEELRKLAQYIIDQGFFDFNYLYDCDSKDKDCNTRLKMSPEPSPLSVVVTVGARRKKIYVALYAPHMESNWVNYPASLEKIVNAIYDVVGK